MDFITQLGITADRSRVQADLGYLLDRHAAWDPGNQIGLRCRAGSANPWKDSAGGLTDRHTGERLAREEDFAEWCPGVPAYTRSVLEALAAAQQVRWGRIRFMRALPKTGLSMHVDREMRYHLAIETNPGAIIAECFTGQAVRCTGHHLPADGHWYRIDTRREHFVYNGGWEPRIHLVANAIG